MADSLITRVKRLENLCGLTPEINSFVSIASSCSAFMSLPAAATEVRYEGKLAKEWALLAKKNEAEAKNAQAALVDLAVKFKLADLRVKSLERALAQSQEEPAGYAVMD